MTETVLTITQERRLIVATEIAAGLVANPNRMPDPKASKEVAIQALVNVAFQIADVMIAKVAREGETS